MGSRGELHPCHSFVLRYSPLCSKEPCVFRQDQGQCERGPLRGHATHLVVNCMETSIRGRLVVLPPQHYYRKIGENVRNFVQNGCNPFCVNDLRTKKHAHDVGWVTALSPQPCYRKSL